MLQRLQTLLLLLPLAVLTNGCITRQLWTASALDEWNMPAPQANVHLYETIPPRDFLVVYDEYAYRHGLLRTRAYFLNESEKRIMQNQAPHFVNTNLADHFSPVPVFSQLEIPVTNRMQDCYAIVATNNQSFTLYATSGRQLGVHWLPIYNDGVGAYQRAALTPATVTADLIILTALMSLDEWASEPDDRWPQNWRKK